MAVFEVQFTGADSEEFTHSSDTVKDFISRTTFVLGPDIVLFMPNDDIVIPFSLVTRVTLVSHYH